MTKRSLDTDVIRNKLDAINRAVKTLASIDDVSEDRLEQDPIIAAAVERFLCRMVELAVETNTHISAVVLGRSPGDYRESFDFAREAGALDKELVERIKPSVGMRNAVVHEYVNVDCSIVSAAVPMAIESYSEYCRLIAGFVVAQIDSEN